jgi:hypothetical protein
MSSPVIIDQLNMPYENWREFRKGYTRNDISDNPTTTTPAKDQLVDGVRIPSQTKMELDLTKNTSLLQVVNGVLSPTALHLEEINSGYTNTLAVTGFDIYPTVTSTLPSGYIITGDGTMVYTKLKSPAPATVMMEWNFADIRGYDRRRVDFVFIRASVEVQPSYTTQVVPDSDALAMDYGGGLYLDLFNTGAYIPIYSGGYLSMRTFMLPVNPFQQTSLKLKALNCYNCNVKFIGIMTGA